MFATPDQIIESVLLRFNERTADMGFGPHSSACLPIKVQDLKEPTGRGGDSSFPVAKCRHLCVYVIAQHCVQHNPYSNTERQLPLSGVGRTFNRTDSAIQYSLKRACSLLAEPVYAQVYQSALDDINARGLELWRAKFTRVDCAQQA